MPKSKNPIAILTGPVSEETDDIFLIHKFKDGQKMKYKSNDGAIYDNLSNFENINDKVERQVEDLVTATESAMSRIEYKIEHKPLTILGLELNYELLI